MRNAFLLKCEFARVINDFNFNRQVRSVEFYGIAYLDLIRLLNILLRKILLSLSLSLSLTHTHTHTHTQSRAHTHSHSLSLTLHCSFSLCLLELSIRLILEWIKAHSVKVRLLVSLYSALSHVMTWLCAHAAPHCTAHRDKAWHCCASVCLEVNSCTALQRHIK